MIPLCLVGSVVIVGPVAQSTRLQTADWVASTWRTSEQPTGCAIDDETPPDIN
jgi:hypothetical protein